MTAPRTQAGRDLLGWWDGTGKSVIEASFAASILAIEAEAIKPYREALERALDALGGMWSWHEEADGNDYLHTGTGHVMDAGRILREAVGRPANPPSRAEDSDAT